MGDALRDRQSLKTLVANRQVIDISGEIGSFERLADSVERDFGALDGEDPPPGWRDWPVRGQLAFGSAGAGDVGGVLTGELEARVPAVCQRCLEPFAWRLETPVDLRFEVGGRTAAATAGERESWELPDEYVQPIDVVDELLVMALPLSPRHLDTADCAVDDARPALKDTTKPFAHLRTQMDEAKKD